MRRTPRTLAADQPLDADLLDTLLDEAVTGRGDQLIPVAGADGTLLGTVTRRDLLALGRRPPGPATVADAVQDAMVSVHPGDTLRDVAYWFAEHGITRAPVVEPTGGGTGRLVGVITVSDLLHARLHDLTEEHHRPRLIPASAPAADDDGPSDTGLADAGAAGQLGHVTAGGRRVSG